MPVSADADVVQKGRTPPAGVAVSAAAANNMDGKMKEDPVFILEVRHKKSWDLIANLTSEVPIFKCPICVQDCCDWTE